jgi:hypothetical protein
VLIALVLGVTQILGATWSQVKTSTLQPSGRYFFGYTLVGSEGVYYGGYNGTSFCGDTWLYDYANNTWKEATTSSGPSPRAYATLNTYKGEAILYGGVTSNNNVFGEVWRYSPAANTWTNDTFANLNASVAAHLPRQFHASAIIGNHLYVFGGGAYGGKAANDLLRYNLDTKEWVVLIENDNASSPTRCMGHTLTPYHDAAVGWTLIAVGGYSNEPKTSGSNEVWQYKVSANAWTNLKPESSIAGRQSHATALVHTVLFLYGGFSTDLSTNIDTYYGDVQALQLNVTGGVYQWKPVILDGAAGPGRRQGHRAATVGEAFHVLGGYQQYVGLTMDQWKVQP